MVVASGWCEVVGVDGVCSQVAHVQIPTTRVGECAMRVRSILPCRIGMSGLGFGDKPDEATTIAGTKLGTPPLR